MGGVPLIETNRELIEREQECAVRGLRDRAPSGAPLLCWTLGVCR